MPGKKARKSNAGKSLVIVESPAKARTLAGILGPSYEVRASIGHVRDLPKSRLGVDIEGGFVPGYVVPRAKQRVVRQLREAARDAEAVYLATDPDREGEAISWHLVQAVDLEERPYYRVVFHEITADAVRAAFRHPRQIDMRLVEAQQARRVLDRLVGYKISPVLWQKIRRGLSAGRVQSVALRMVVEREREIENFVPQEYWTIDATLARAADGAEAAARFQARLVGLVGKKKLEVVSESEAQRLVGLLRETAYQVSDVKKRAQLRRPAPPFTTSTLQQEASRRFGFSAKRTMAVAQQLYEGLALPGQGQVGLITYMRTDSTQVAEVARQEAREYVVKRFGAEFVPGSARTYRTRAKRAQEAHEAIRPTSVWREPQALRRVLSRDQLRLYGLIWQRMVASQMADAVYDQTTVEVVAEPPSGHERYLLRATESILRFPGYRRLYHEARESRPEEEPPALPELAPGDALRLVELTPEQHFTEPPPRFTEATLVKALEENGIGRPSTYAPILSTIQERGYVTRDGRYLRPEELGRVVNDLLTEHFPDVVDLGFTAEMEDELDEIARGDRPWEPVVRQFYAPLKEALEAAAQAPRLEELTEERCEKCGRPMLLRWGRFGRFLACSGFPECHSTRPLPGESDNAEPIDEQCEVCGAPMVIKSGRYGRFLACSRYPECRETRRLLNKIGVACPLCGGDIVEKRTRRRRLFYGCSAYPGCKFTSWSRPLEAPCPSCGGLLLASPRGRARCSRCAWRGRAPTGEP
ncbi:MAG: type I DNA topoisomerase, partial [Dehalococcoidia bacterium]